jgi:hypothetical protein
MNKFKAGDICLWKQEIIKLVSSDHTSFFSAEEIPNVWSFIQMSKPQGLITWISLAHESDMVKIETPLEMVIYGVKE